jgi:hypothetical protein
MNTVEEVVKSFMDAKGIKRRNIAKKLKLSVWQFNHFIKDENPGPAARQLIALALGLTLRDFDEMCRQHEGEKA